MGAVSGSVSTMILLRVGSFPCLDEEFGDMCYAFRAEDSLQETYCDVVLPRKICFQKEAPSPVIAFSNASRLETCNRLTAKPSTRESSAAADIEALT